VNCKFIAELTKHIAQQGVICPYQKMVSRPIHYNVRVSVYARRENRNGYYDHLHYRSAGKLPFISSRTIGYA
jgi:hypothetical protein